MDGERFEIARNTFEGVSEWFFYLEPDYDIRVVKCSIDNSYYEEQEWWQDFSFVMRDRAALEDGK